MRGAKAMSIANGIVWSEMLVFARLWSLEAMLRDDRHRSYVSAKQIKVKSHAHWKEQK